MNLPRGQKARSKQSGAKLKKFNDSEMSELENINPRIYKRSDERPITTDELNNDVADPIDEREFLVKFEWKKNVDDGI